MSHFNFVIPGNKAELLSENDDYYVKDIVGPKDLITQLKNAKISLRDEGVEFIIDKFDVYYSVLHHGDSLPMDVIFRTYEDLHRVSVDLNKALGFLLEDKDSINDEIRIKYLNILKMVTYVYIQTVKLIEQKNEAKNQGLSLKGRKKSTKDSENYIVNKKNVLLVLNNILQREITTFWDPPVVEENFINMVSEICYQFLQSPTIKGEKEVRVEIFSLIGLLIKGFNHGTTFVIRTVQLIKMHEHLVYCLPEGVQHLVQNYGCKGLVHDLVREVTEWQTEESYQDSQGARFCAQILSEMAVLMPDLMIPEVMYLNRYLAYDSATLRNSVLTVITEIILNVLTKHDLTEDEKESRDEFIAILTEHMDDVAAHVRSKVMQHWARLQKENAIPLKYQQPILEKVVMHLFDKGALVRKSAASCVTMFLQHNAFSSNLSLSQMQAELDKKEKLLESVKSKFENIVLAKVEKIEEEWNSKRDALLAVVKEELEKDKEDNEDEEKQDDEKPQVPKDQMADMVRLYLNEGKYKDAFTLCRSVGQNMEEWQQFKDNPNIDEAEAYVIVLHSIFANVNKLMEELKAGAATQGPTKMTEEDLKKMETLENVVDFLKDSVNFLKLIGSAVKPMTELLETTAISDMQEAVEFFTAAYQFNIDNALEGVLAMLKIMQRNEQERKDLVVAAFKTIYLSTDSKNMAEHTTTIVNRLINLLKTIPTNNLDDLQLIISEWTTKGILDNSVIDMLWQYFTKKSNVSDEDSRASADLLKMAALGRKTIMTRNIKLVATVAFADRGENDMLFLASSCELLAVAGRERIDITSKNHPFKIKVTDEIFKNLIDILVKKFFEPVDYYSKALAASIDFIYKLSSKPEKLCEDLTADIVNKLAKDHSEKEMDKFLIFRCCQLLGNIAVKHLEYLDDTVHKELKRRHNIREERKEAKRHTKSPKKKDKKRLTKSTNVSNNESTLNSTMNDESTLEGAQAEDADAEFILNILEYDTVSGSGGLGKLSYIIRSVCERPDIYDDVYVQSAAVIALMRFMLVSSKFCQNQIQLLFTIFEKTTHEEVKCSILVHCSDLLTRFPNIVEPWTPRIYQRLKDESDVIRKATFFILSNLILRDMIRAHSHIAEMVCCLVDDDEELSGMCKTFFVNLSHKENNLYNVLPDIFTHLMELESMSVENAQNIMKFLFNLMDKTKHMENLVDRFCCKFRLTENLKHHQNIAFCLTLIHYNEKALKKLQENFPVYKLLVQDPEIYSHFKTILASCNKQQIGKTDLKPIVAEIEANINSVFEINEDGMLMKPPPIPKPTKKPKRAALKKKTPRKRNNSSSDDEGDWADSEKENNTKNTSRKSNRNRKAKKVIDDSDSD